METLDKTIEQDISLLRLLAQQHSITKKEPDIIKHYQQRVAEYSLKQHYQVNTQTLRNALEDTIAHYNLTRVKLQ